MACCCFVTVRSGTYASGIYSLILALLNAALVVYDIHLLHKPVEFNADEIAHLNVSELRWQGDVPRISQLLIKADVLYMLHICFYSLVGINIFVFTTAIILLYGVHKNRKQLLLPWVVCMCMSVFMDTAILIYQCIKLNLLTFNIVHMVVWSVITLLNIYCILCVMSQYQELKLGPSTGQQNEPQQQVRYCPGALQPVHITHSPPVLPQNGTVASQACVASTANAADTCSAKPRVPTCRPRTSRPVSSRRQKSTVPSVSTAVMFCEVDGGPKREPRRARSKTPNHRAKHRDVPRRVTRTKNRRKSQSQVTKESPPPPYHP